jgi:hypothetical protein
MKWLWILFIFVFGFLASTQAHDANIVEYKIENWRANGRSVLVYNNYTFGVTGIEYVSGSATTNGGTSTLSAGLILAEDLYAEKNFGIKHNGGSSTVRIYGFVGSTSSNCKMELAALSLSGATDTSFVTAKDYLAFLVGAQCTNGTSTLTLGLNEIEKR